MAAQFMLLRWDAYARIGQAVRERWTQEKTQLMSIPEGREKDDLIYDLDAVSLLRDETKMLGRSMGIPLEPPIGPISTTQSMAIGIALI